MSILNCSTRVTIVNCTGLPASFTFKPDNTHMRLQPLDSAQVNASVDTNASTITEWFQEWVHLISYGPTYNKLDWQIDANSQATVRFEVEKPMNVFMKWSDPSVSWEKHGQGQWNIDITKAIDVTIYLRAELGQYIKSASLKGPAQIKSVELKPYLEIGCDDEIPFIIEKQPVANMFWSKQINLDQIVNPNND